MRIIKRVTCHQVKDIKQPVSDQSSHIRKRRSRHLRDLRETKAQRDQKPRKKDPILDLEGPLQPRPYAALLGGFIFGKEGCRLIGRHN